MSKSSVMTPPAISHRVTTPLATSAEVRHGLQGMAGFLLGALVALIFSMAPAVWSDSPDVSPIRYLGYMLGGAIGGGAMLWGYPGPRAGGAAALGFGVSFLLPALFAAPQADALLTLKPEDYGPGVFVSCFLAYSISYGLAGAMGMAFAVPRLWWKTLWLFFVSGGVGGLLVATGPWFGGASAANVSGVFRMLAMIFIGHLVAFTFGGWLAGHALEQEPAREYP